MSQLPYVLAFTRAEERAKKKYPKQPNRAERMVDKEIGHYHGFLALEPLTWSQRILYIFGLVDHEVNLHSDASLTETKTQRFKRRYKRNIRFFFTGS